MSTHSHNLAHVVALAGTLIFLALGASCSSVQPGPQASPVGDLDRAILSLKTVSPDDIDPDKFSPAQQQEETKAIEDAWHVLDGFGQKGIERLKEEAKKSPPQSDNFFKLNAARYLWLYGERGRPGVANWQNWKEVPDILAIWKSARLSYHLHYPFHTAFEAAETQDPRALPLMKALLKEHEGVVAGWHGMRLAWPATDQLIWGVYGSKGLPVLLEVLSTSTDRNERSSAAHLLSDAQYLPALPHVRQLAQDADPEARGYGMVYLAAYGHPDDFPLLVSGLQGQDRTLLRFAAFALGLYEDLRSVPLLIPLLESEDGAVRNHTSAALARLITPASLDALHRHAQRAVAVKEREVCERRVNALLKRMDLTWESYLERSPGERADLLKRLRTEQWLPKPGRPPLTREQFLADARRWKEQHRFPESITARDLSPAIAPKDIDLLLEVKASVLRRRSDEAWYEAVHLDSIVMYLGRTRYRTVPGLTEKAERKP